MTLAEVRGPLTLLALLLATGCGGVHPLGEDWGALDDEARLQRTVEVTAALIAGGVSDSGKAFQDRIVLRCDLDGVAYERDGQTSELRWEDVKSVQARTDESLPSRPETLVVHLEPDSPSLKSIKDLVTPALASACLARPHLLLRSRERWARNRMLRALIHLSRLRKKRDRGLARARQAATEQEPEGHEPEAEPPSDDPEPESEEAEADGKLAEIKAKLTELKSWYESGLITKEDYDQKRSDLLEGL